MTTNVVRRDWGRPFLVAFATALLFAGTARAEDWPMYRHDARHSAATPHGLPKTLRPQWRRHLPALKPAWPDQAKLQADAVYEPVVLGKRMFVGSSFDDSVTALDTRTGKELWRFHTNGPVRFAPAAWEGKVYFTSDDGYLYCLDAAKGTLLWKFRGGPSDRLVLGNGRLVSTWPARGAPVIADGKVYFAAGIWPFMGIFLHALDARTGKVVWTNDGDGCIYIKQPHNANSFAGVAPQGPLVVAGGRGGATPPLLLVPGGRSVPACFDRQTGKLLYYELARNGKRGGGAEVAATDQLILNGGAAFDLRTEQYLGPIRGQVAFTDKVLYSLSGDNCRALDLSTSAIKTVETVDRKGKKEKETKWVIDEVGAVETIKAGAMIVAGDRLYLGGEGKIVALDLPLPKSKRVTASWEAEVKGTVASLLAADDRLFAVTREGGIYCFGEGETPENTVNAESALQADRDAAERLLKTADVHAGYAVVWGAIPFPTLRGLAETSDLQLVVIENDAKKVGELRKQLRLARIPAERIAVLHADPKTVRLPPYFASVMFAEMVPTPGPGLNREAVGKLFASLRPFGGTACLRLARGTPDEFRRLVDGLSLPGAKVKRAGNRVLLVREGPLPGSGNWTHEHADAANTRVSPDKLAKAPLGVLWWGGPSHEGILPRHGHGPQPQVIDGRIIIEGVDMLRCMDCYTGRVLWEAKLPGVGAFYNYTGHQPGANSSGGNYVCTPDGIYVAYRDRCLRLDPDTGKTVAEFKLPSAGDDKGPPRWGYVNVAGDYLIGGADPLLTFKDDKEPDDATGLLKLLAKLKKGQNDNLSSSKQLVVMDRHSGKVLWSATAKHGFRHNAVCVGGGRLYCIDRLSGPQLSRLQRRGEEPKVPARLFAFDLKTGKKLWRTDKKVFGTWLSYSAERDVLVEAGRVARDTIADEPKGMRAYEAGTGRVLWFEEKHAGPAMIHGDTILMAGEACELLTGKPKMRKDPLTGELTEWTWKRNYGCNTPAASEHLLTFRSGAAGYYDLCNDGGTGNFGGFRSSCTNNLIVAAGLLNAPDYTRTCTCLYQNQTSLALVHMPEAQMWTFFDSEETDGPVKRLGLNFGAPGDRRAENDTLWVEHPVVAGKSPSVPVKMVPEKPKTVRRHPSGIEGGLPWVAASAVEGLTALNIELSDDRKAPERRYTVRLHFAELEGAQPGERVFDVGLQGEKVLARFDIVKEAGGLNRGLVKEFKGVKASEKLSLTFAPSGNGKLAPLLSGIEVVAEEE